MGAEGGNFNGDGTEKSRAIRGEALPLPSSTPRPNEPTHRKKHSDHGSSSTKDEITALEQRLIESEERAIAAESLALSYAKGAAEAQGEVPTLTPTRTCTLHYRVYSFMYCDCGGAQI